MKKTVLTIAMLSLAAGAFAQKANIRTAQDYLSDNNYRKAMPVIEEAVANEATKDNADAWFYRGHTYLLQAMDSTAKNPDAIKESLRSFSKTLELKPGYDAARIDGDIQNLAIVAYQEGVVAYNKADYATSYDRFLMASNIYKTGGGKRFAANKQFTSIASNSKQYAASSALQMQKNDDALKLLMEVKDEQTPKDSNTYFSIIQILEQQKKYDQLQPVITEGLATFPNSRTIRTAEINYYINTGKSDQLLPKLEAAAQNDPTNADIQFMIGNVNEKLSFPKDANGSTKARPANAAESFAKAESAYKAAMAISPDNQEYTYNLGVIYYEYAADYNDQLSTVSGSSAADRKKYDEIIAKRNAQFAIAQPYFEKVYNTLNTREATLNPSEKRTYTQAVIGLQEIYSRQNNKVKTEEFKKKKAELLK